MKRLARILRRLAARLDGTYRREPRPWHRSCEGVSGRVFRFFVASAFLDMARLTLGTAHMAARAVEMSTPDAAPSTGQQRAHCSFCNKVQYDVGYMIAAPVAYICDECVALCVTIIAEAKVMQRTADPAGRVAS